MRSCNKSIQLSLQLKESETAINCQISTFAGIFIDLDGLLVVTDSRHGDAFQPGRHARDHLKSSFKNSSRNVEKQDLIFEGFFHFYIYL